MQIYLVGGAVRDEMLGLAVKDRDWVVVGASADELLALGYRPVGRDFPVFIRPDTGEEYALARTERKSGHGYAGFQFHASPDVTLEDDLARRDLTINAMARSAQGELIDPYGGQRDIAARKLRHVSDAFSEDPLRVLRVARFAARFAPLGFDVADETLELMRQISQSGELEHLTTERVWQEFERALATPQPLVFLEVLKQAEALTRLLPEFAQLDLGLTAPALNRLKALDTSPESCFALLCELTLATGTDPRAQQIIQMAERLKAPNRFRDLAVQFCNWHETLYRLEQVDAAKRLEMILSLRLLKKNSHLSALLHLTQARHPDFDLQLSIRLQDLLLRLERISTQDLMRAGFSGKALGQAIEAEQLKYCSIF
nr:hypothetical protein [Nitrincola alkalilacustris]